MALPCHLASSMTQISSAPIYFQKNKRPNSVTAACYGGQAERK